MSQLEQLITTIKSHGYLSYNRVKDEAERINPLWRESSWTRGLRRRKDIKSIHKGNNPLEVIVGYEEVIAYKPLLQPVQLTLIK